MLKILAIDTETTGIRPTDEVIQLAAISVPDQLTKLRPNLDVKELHICDVKNPRRQSAFFPQLEVINNYFYPNVEIHPEAYNIHKLSKIKLLGQPDSALCELPKETELVLAHNANFDLRMLHAKEMPAICTMQLIKKIEKLQNGKFGLENYKLFTVFCHFYPQLRGVFNDNRHDALADCEMLLLVMLKVMENFPLIKTVRGVHEKFFTD